MLCVNVLRVSCLCLTAAKEHGLAPRPPPSQPKALAPSPCPNEPLAASLAYRHDLWTCRPPSTTASALFAAAQPPDRLGRHGLKVRRRDALRGPRVRAVVFYAVVSDEIEQVIEFFVDRGDAETMLARVLVDEPE